MAIQAQFGELGAVYGCIDRLGCQRLSEDYGAAGDGGGVRVVVAVDADQEAALRAAVVDGTGGRCTAERVAVPAGT